MTADVAEQPFRFPLDAETWPIHDSDVGVAFPKGGMQGSFHAGVVHAFVLSGYFPRQLGGSSMGVYAAVALAAAGERTSQEERLALVAELVAVWRKNPGRSIFGRVWHGSALQEFTAELMQLRISTVKLLESVWAIWRGSPWARVRAGVRLWLGLPLTSRGMRARVNTVAALVRGLGDAMRRRDRDLSLRVAQAVLDAYGMRDSLLSTNPIDEGFDDFFSKWLKGSEGDHKRLEDFENSNLTFQLTNLRLAGIAAGERGAVNTRPVIVVRDGDGADLIAAIRAASSLQPMHAPVKARAVFGEHMPEGIEPDDALVDSSYISYLPIGAIIERWKEEDAAARARPKRIFTIYGDPLAGAASPVTGFFGSGLHDLYLLRQRDFFYDLTLTRLITELLRAAPPEDDTLQVVDCSPIAPAEMLGFMSVSVPEDEQLDAAIASGCRAALEVLHATSLAELGALGETVPCPMLMAHLRSRSTAPEGYFSPSSDVCQGCSAQLRVPGVSAEGTEAERRKGTVRPSDRLSRLWDQSTPPAVPPTVVVPAGGAFLGVFHIGALVALREHGVQPDIYAGTSVGTMFSILLHAGLRPGEPINPRLIDRMLDVDDWVDLVADPVPGLPDGQVDRLIAKLMARLKRPAVRDMLRLRPGRLFAALRRMDARGHEEHDLIQHAFVDLLYPAAEGPQGGALAALAPVDAAKEANELVDAVLAGSLERILAGLDRVARHFGVYEEGREHEGELIGFGTTYELIRTFAFDGAAEVPSLESHGGDESHFIFTVTNHTNGRLELFGGPPSEGVDASPEALQAVLAGSSLPLAFRRRTRAEVFGMSEAEAAADPTSTDVFADGGIFNNFPVDSALKYLRFLTQDPGYSWLGAQEVRFLLLPLDFPGPPPSPDAPQHGCLRAATLTWRQGDHEKLHRILTQQVLVQSLAERANAAIRGGSNPGRRQAILADFDVVAPAKKVYPGAFSFKEWLGFSPDKQLELLADGCRRTRYALLYRAWVEEQREAGLDTDLNRFDRLWRGQIEAWKDEPGDHCVLGGLNIGRCAFVEVGTRHGESVRSTCAATALDDLEPDSLPLTNRVDIWERLVSGAVKGLDRPAEVAAHGDDKTPA